MKLSEYEALYSMGYGSAVRIRKQSLHKLNWMLALIPGYPFWIVPFINKWVFKHDITIRRE